jgi:hypothetical protein
MKFQLAILGLCLAIAFRVPGQENKQQSQPKHHPYGFIDLGMLGGLVSYHTNNSSAGLSDRNQAEPSQGSVPFDSLLANDLSFSNPSKWISSLLCVQICEL